MWHSVAGRGKRAHGCNAAIADTCRNDSVRHYATFRRAGSGAIVARVEETPNGHFATNGRTLKLSGSTHSNLPPLAPRLDAGTCFAYINVGCVAPRMDAVCSVLQ
jgi:hypothetical protein